MKHKSRRPLDGKALENMALRYVGRYATTRSKLRTYLRRKLQERGWQGDAEPDLEALVERFVGLGYVDDAAYAAAKTDSLQRRGYGDRRITQALGAAGIAAGDIADARSVAAENAMDAAIRFARRKRIGPFAVDNADRAAREKAFGTMVRAGHALDIIRAVLALAPGDLPESE
jgi:regulatory protein